MTIVADGGATKTDWAVVESGLRFTTRGYNPYFISGEDISADLRANIPSELSPEDISHVHFFGAGVTETRKDGMRQALRDVFVCAEDIEADSDLIGAAKALLGDTPGIAAILGTGCNSCLWNGKTIEEKIPSLGFILGDEGSGGYMGKNLLRDYSRGVLPSDSEQELRNMLGGLDANGIIERVYRGEAPNAFCASLCPFILSHIHIPYFSTLVTDSFVAFFDNLISRYSNYRDFSICFVGGVANSFRDILTRVAQERGISVGKIIAAPIEGLINYYV